MPPRNASFKPLIVAVQLAVVMKHPTTLQLICTHHNALPVLLNAGDLTAGVHYVLVTNTTVASKNHLIHNPKDDSSACGVMFREIIEKMGWSFTWHHYETQLDSDTCGFRVVMLAVQWCTTIKLKGQLPRRFLEYCASVPQLFATDSSTLRPTVYTFHDCMSKDALTEYDEPVPWATTECGTLPTPTHAETHAASWINQWRPSSPSSSASGAG